MPDATDTATIGIRMASPTEVELVHALTQAAFAETASFANPSSALDETLDSVRRELNFGFAAVAWLGDEPVGVVRFEVERANRPFEPGEHQGGTLTFKRMGVAPDARGRGVGTELIAWLEHWARQIGLDEMVACARSQQPDNRPFYTERGFAITGYSERYGIPDIRAHLHRAIAYE